MALSGHGDRQREAIEVAKAWTEVVWRALRALMVGGAASSGVPQVTDAARVQMVLQSLLDSWTNRPGTGLLVRTVSAASPIESVQLLEDLVAEVLDAAGVSREGGITGGVDDPAEFLSGIREDVQRDALDILCSKAMEELECIKERLVDAEAVAMQLSPAEARWLRALGEIVSEAEFEPSHLRIAERLGIIETTSQNLSRRLRALGLIGPRPKLRDEHLDLTEFGWRVWTCLPPIDGASPDSSAPL